MKTNPRYFVTLRFPNHPELGADTKPLGRFIDADAAKLHATVKYFKNPEVEVIGVRLETRAEALTHSTSRFLLRSARVVCGCALGICAFGWWSSTKSITGIPFSELTLGMIGGAIGAFWLLCIGLYVSWHIAFGEGPQE